MKVPVILFGVLVIPAIVFAQPNPNDSGAQVSPPPPPAPTSEPAPVPASYTAPQPEYQEITDSYNAPMFMTGALVFAASYGTSVVVAASTNGDRGNDRLYVPIAGPWLALNDRGSCDITRSSCDHETTAKVLLIADGVFQAAGVIGMLDGILQPSSHRVVTRTAKLDTKLHLQPTMVRGAPGLAGFGRF